jgi:hypothetical protein
VNDDCWKDDLSDEDLGEVGEDEYVVLPQPPFKVIYGPAGAVRTDLERAHRQMNMAAATSKRPGDPRDN